MNEEMKRLEDKFDHAILLARQSTPESLSPLLLGIKKDIKDSEHRLMDRIEKLQEWTVKHEPNLERLGKDYQGISFIGWLFGNLVKGILGVGVIAGAWLWGKEHFYK